MKFTEQVVKNIIKKLHIPYEEQEVENLSCFIDKILR